MKIVNAQPPILQQILDAGMKPNAKVIFTYGDTIFNPGCVQIADHLIIHEETHSRQQGDDPETWWSRYLDDQYFRIEQEVEAYANQYAFLCKRVKDRNQRSRILTDLAKMLSGPIYGNVIGYQAAYSMIKNKANVKP